MRRRESALFGPRPARPGDVDELNRVFADSFTDRYRRDGLVGVRVPRLSPRVWQYALQDSGEGAMVWTDRHDRIAAFNIAHRSGSEGWMGPLAVRPDLQGAGLGRAVVTAAVDWLRDARVRTLGLETMPRTVENIGFYSHLGFVPGRLTVTMVCDADPTITTDVSLLSELDAESEAATIAGCAKALGDVSGGIDFTSELRLTRSLDVGDAAVMQRDGVAGFVLWHSTALIEGRSADELRILKLYAASPDVFERLLDAAECCACRQGLRRVSIRCQTAFPDAYMTLIRRGYRVRWTDLRMTLAGYPAPRLAPGSVVLSNWEI